MIQSKRWFCAILITLLALNTAGTNILMLVISYWSRDVAWASIGIENLLELYTVDLGIAVSIGVVA